MYMHWSIVLNFTLLVLWKSVGFFQGHINLLEIGGPNKLCFHNYNTVNLNSMKTWYFLRWLQPWLQNLLLLPGLDSNWNCYKNLHCILKKSEQILPLCLCSTNEPLTVCLCVCLFFLNVQVACKAVMVFFHYCVMSNYFWLFIEGLYLFTLLVETFFPERRYFYWYTIVGWGEYPFRSGYQ